jgi:hypothetical protein
MPESGFCLHVGERGKWSGGWNGAHSGMRPLRNARRRAADGGHAAFAAYRGCAFERSARFEKRSGRGREDTGPTGSPCSGAEPCVGHVADALVNTI